MSIQQLVTHERMSVEELKWHEICPVDYVVPGTGVAALVQGEQIAIIRTNDGLLAALSNFD
ncbi:MAG TPA: nitrite reductase (NAD(P)H) small subunit, partial [Polyangiaceae bacterium]|nr:nitrite reductase (NAD(P)H) small subunit [Polyangiaceae bacterium]